MRNTYSKCVKYKEVFDQGLMAINLLPLPNLATAFLHIAETLHRIVIYKMLLLENHRMLSI